MKKTVIYILIMTLLLCGCGGGDKTANETTPEPEISEEELPESPDSSMMPDFESRDLDGNIFTSDIFAENTLTVVNIWGTFCPPCIQEMPELAEWYRELPEGVDLFGIICDVGFSQNDDVAREILTSAGAEFPNVIVCEDLMAFLSEVMYVPTTLFVSTEGEIVNIIIGADVPAYRSFVEEYLVENAA